MRYLQNDSGGMSHAAALNLECSSTLQDWNFSSILNRDSRLCIRMSPFCPVNTVYTCFDTIKIDHCFVGVLVNSCCLVENLFPVPQGMSSLTVFSHCCLEQWINQCLYFKTLFISFTLYSNHKFNEVNNQQHTGGAIKMDLIRGHLKIKKSSYQENRCHNAFKCL